MPLIQRTFPCQEFQMASGGRYTLIIFLNVISHAIQSVFQGLFSLHHEFKRQWNVYIYKPHGPMAPINHCALMQRTSTENIHVIVFCSSLLFEKSWISNYSHVQLLDVITHPSCNFNGSLVEPQLNLKHGCLVSYFCFVWIWLLTHTPTSSLDQ